MNSLMLYQSPWCKSEIDRLFGTLAKTSQFFGLKDFYVALDKADVIKSYFSSYASMKSGLLR